MAFPSPRSLRSASPHDHTLTLSRVPWFDSRRVSDEDIVMLYGRDDHLTDQIPLFALKCDDFLSFLCALDAELEVSAHSRFLARKRFVRACGIHWAALGGRISSPAAAGLDLLFARSDDMYTFCR